MSTSMSTADVADLPPAVELEYRTTEGPGAVHDHVLSR
jgi:hypothetical protein